MFEKILVANRGEIALRVMRTAKNMGIKCVAIFSEADKHSQHVKMADEAILIGPAPSSESYLQFEKVVDAMKRTGSEAVHPGYGFLSENYKFAEIIEKSNLNFIGPPSTAIKAMGSKSESKTIMISARVPCIPGYHDSNQDPEFLAKKADEIGYPVMIKAVLGGGGKGMRIANNPDEFIEMLGSAKRESLKSFGDDRVILEKFIKRSRHIEVQIFADKHGNCVYLFERDCSIQRRNQKIIEEAPAHGISDQLRKSLGETAVKAAKAVNYVGPGTVEFIYDCSDGSFYFMEMNTRLQVEHPVTEMITGKDLVEWQIKAAAGYNLPSDQNDLSIFGHSIEARIYAEIPEKNFMPDTGNLALFKAPPNSDNLRIETGVKENDNILIYYDPMIAKVIASGKDRDEAVRRLDKALSELLISGVSTNIQFIQKILRINEFKNSEIDTNFIENHKTDLFSKSKPPKNVLITAAIVKTFGKSQGIFDPFKYFRINSTGKENIDLIHNHIDYTVGLEINDDKMSANLSDSSNIDVFILENDGGYIRTLIGNEVGNYYYFIDKSGISIWTNEHGRFDFSLKSKGISDTISDQDMKGSDGRVFSSMPCKINSITVRPGDKVQIGSPLCVTEAMKMELIIKSNVTGIVKNIHFKEGDVVADKSLLMELDTLNC